MNQLHLTLLKYWTVNLQKWIAVICCIGAMAGLLFSRALISASLILLFANALHPHIIKCNWEQTKRSWFAVLCFLIYVCYLLSGLWSSDVHSWLASIRIKLPMMILPFAFFSIPFNDKRFFGIIALGILLILYVGVGYSLLVSNYNWQGLSAGVHLTTPMHNDYLRFSMALLIGVIICCYLLFQYQGRLPGLIKGFLIFWLVTVIIYLHVLAAKSGVLFLYIILIVFSAYKLYKANKYYAVVGIVFRN